MLEQANTDSSPNILPTEKLKDGSLKFETWGATAQDVFATIYFYESDPESADRKIGLLFDVAVERGMLNNTSIPIGVDTTVDEHVAGVTFERNVRFGDIVTPELAREAFYAACLGNEELATSVERNVLSQCIDSGLLDGFIYTDDHNEVINSSPDALASEMDELTDRHYNGQGLGGPNE